MATVQEVIEGLKVLSKYCDPLKDNICAEHDIIYACPSVGENTPSSDDLIRLDELGWFWDREADSWARFT